VIGNAFACYDRRLKFASKQNSLWLEIFRNMKQANTSNQEKLILLFWRTRPFRFGAACLRRPAGGINQRTPTLINSAR
jgi:hypothetical protein